MNITYAFFNTDATLPNGKEIEEERIKTMGNVENIKLRLIKAFRDIEWELGQERNSRSWQGMGSSCEPYFDISIPFKENGDVCFVFFRNPSAATLSQALGVLKTNNVFLDGDQQIINDLKRAQSCDNLLQRALGRVTLREPAKCRKWWVTG